MLPASGVVYVRLQPHSEAIRAAGSGVSGTAPKKSAIVARWSGSESVQCHEYRAAGDGRRQGVQWHPPSQPQALPFRDSTTSLPMIGTITSAATGSAHHQPNNAFRSKPPNRIADKYVQKSACLESAFMALLPIPAATRRFARANNGMTTTDTAATMMPGMLRSAASCRISVEPDS